MPKFAANLTMLFNEVPFLERFDAAAKAGFEGVEFLFPYDFGKQELRAALDRNDLTQVLHNLPAGDWGRGERGIAVLPDRIDEFRRGVIQAIDYATALGCNRINCLSGIAPAGLADDVLRTTFISNLRLAASELAKHDIRLLIEPINHYDIPGFYLNTVEQAGSIIEEVGSNNLFIQYDLYHQQRTRGELIATYERYKNLIAHVQLADNPGRHEPGTGEINYPFVFEALDQAGYDGWIGCEYKPKAETQRGLGWLNDVSAAQKSADILRMRS
ncbi:MULTISPECIES: 2-oxo-tetronate isomerase [unclassified Phyllobacterium]|uniref:2-oxo-tetronate isomerase n=1 Tax=Phyllobacterium TaxID=28100 RepID=UPI000DDC0B37|nr:MULTISPECIES: 2-oxo-tetronate isomerase [unclassified Phyllobacterium]MBA8903291.1 hydroxypyruvate isomerase [Phyllobacterium sp. P30BS-XVII]UGX88360.1 hydroxypyruvate isomerase [Phyllobacterium sp. T1293]